MILRTFFMGMVMTQACASTSEQVLRHDLEIQGQVFSLREEQQSIDLDGTLADAVAAALQLSPDARAAFERWRAATLSISKSRRLPDPVLSYGYFIRSVETRTGPQRHRFGLSQSFPWPTKLSAGGDTAAKKARAAQFRFDAELLALRRRVSTAYWKLWFLEQTHQLKKKHDAILGAMVDSVRAQVKTGFSSLAELSQIELNLARHLDHHGQHKQAFRTATANLRRAIGLLPKAGELLRARDSPAGGIPKIKDSDMLSWLREHPDINRHAALAEASLHSALAAGADRFPGFKVGIEYIETGEVGSSDSPTLRNDPVVVSAAISLPVWLGSYAKDVEANEAEARAHYADRDVALRIAEASLESTLSRVLDAQRKIDLIRTTLLPQARATYRSILGGYRAGRVRVAESLLAQRDLLELQIGLRRTKVDHAVAYVDLEWVLGRHVPRKNREHDE